MFALHHWYVATCKQTHVSQGAQRFGHLRAQSFPTGFEDWVTYQSPLPSPRPRLGPSLLELPAAAEAKLDVKGEGIMESEKFEEIADIL